MTNDPVEDAAANGDKQDAYNDAVEAAEVALKRGFIALCNSGDAKALDMFAASHNYLDYNRGPSTVDLIQIVLNAARGQSVETEAVVMLQRMATTYACYNVDTKAIGEQLA